MTSPQESMMTSTSYPNVARALQNLASQFTCDHCQASLHTPISMGNSCQHILCPECAPTLEHSTKTTPAVNACPVCHLPSRVKDRKELKQFSGMLCLVRRMMNSLQHRVVDGQEAPSCHQENAEEMEMQKDTVSREVLTDKPLNDIVSTHTSKPVIAISRKRTRSSLKRKSNETTDNSGKGAGMATANEEAPSDTKAVATPQITFKKARVESTSSGGAGAKPTIHFKAKSTPKADSPKVKLIRFLPRRNRRSISPSSRSMNTTLNSSTAPGTASATSTPGSHLRLQRNRRGESQLHQAVIRGDLERVRQLLSASPPHPVNVVDNLGWTPLHEAVNLGRLAIAELLLRNGANIDQPGGDARVTPLIDAVENGRIDCVRLLREFGADVTLRNLAGETAVMLLGPQSSPELISALRDTPVDAEKVAARISAAEGDTSEVGMDTSVGNQTMPAVTEGGSSTPPCILCSSRLTRTQREQVSRVAQLLGGCVVDMRDGQLTHKCTQLTHVVTLCMGENDEDELAGQSKSLSAGQLVTARTIKYLLGVAQGAWIVSYGWVSACAYYSSHVDEMPFEVSGDSSSSLAVLERRVPHVARLARRLRGQPGIFSGCQFSFHGEFRSPSPSRAELITLVKFADGICHSRELRSENIDSFSQTVPYYASAGHPLENCGFFVIYNQTPPRDSWPSTASSSRLCRLPVAWLMNCVAQFELLNPDAFLEN